MVKLLTRTFIFKTCAFVTSKQQGPFWRHIIKWFWCNSLTNFETVNKSQWQKCELQTREFFRKVLIYIFMISANFTKRQICLCYYLSNNYFIGWLVLIIWHIKVFSSYFRKNIFLKCFRASPTTYTWRLPFPHEIILQK